MKIFSVEFITHGMGSYQSQHFVLAETREQAIELATAKEIELNKYVGELADVTEIDMQDAFVFFSYDTFR